MELYQNTPLWKNAIDLKGDIFDKPRSVLVMAHQEFCNRVALLLQQIQKELPLLTLHDITQASSSHRCSALFSADAV
jgi:hypothetical protein